MHIADPGTSLQEALRSADIACYMAKEKGRNRVQVHRPSDTEVQARFGEMDWVRRLRGALEENRFCLFAQEIAAIGAYGRDGAHIEVLLRLRDEEGRLVPPNSFIPAAERYGLMPQIDRWVVRRTFATLAERTALAGSMQVAACAINLSGATFNDESFVGFVRDEFDRPRHRAGSDLLRDHRDGGDRRHGERHPLHGRAARPRLPLRARRFRRRHVVLRLSEAPSRRLPQDRRRLRQGHAGRPDRPGHGRDDQPHRQGDGQADHRGIRRDQTPSSRRCATSASISSRATPSPAPSPSTPQPC